MLTNDPYFGELKIGSSLKYKSTLFGNYFFQMSYAEKNFNILQLFSEYEYIHRSRKSP